MQQENSPETTGMLTLYDVDGNGEDQVEIYFGSNRCDIYGEISGLKVTR